MMNPGRLLQMLVICMVCASCAPIIPVLTHAYYPEANTGKVIGDHCPINKHIPYGILFSRLDIQVLARLGKYEAKRYIEIRFEVPEGKTVELAKTSAQLVLNASGQPIQVEFERVLLAPFYSVINAPDHIRIETLDVNAPMIGESRQTPIETSKAFWLASFLELPNSDIIQVTLPTFTVNEEPVALPAITFQKKRVIGFYVINC